MIQRCFTYALVATSLMVSPMAMSEERNDVMSENHKVVAAIETMTNAFNARNITPILSSYETGAAVMFEPGKQVVGTDTLKQMFEGAFQLNPQFTYPNGHEVYIANDIALHIAPWVMAATTPDGNDIEQRGLSVAVLRKQENGEWLMVLDNPHGQRLLHK